MICLHSQFHLKQVKLRSTIRIREGRAKPIDLLAKYISAEDDDLDVEMHEPYTYLNVSVWQNWRSAHRKLLRIKWLIYLCWNRV